MSEQRSCTGDPLCLVAKPASWRHSREPVTVSADLLPPSLLKEARVHGFGLLSVIHEGFSAVSCDHVACANKSAFFVSYLSLFYLRRH